MPSAPCRQSSGAKRRGRSGDAEPRTHLFTARPEKGGTRRRWEPFAKQPPEGALLLPKLATSAPLTAPRRRHRLAPCTHVQAIKEASWLITALIIYVCVLKARCSRASTWKINVCGSPYLFFSIVWECQQTPCCYSEHCAHANPWASAESSCSVRSWMLSDRPQTGSSPAVGCDAVPTSTALHTAACAALTDPAAWQGFTVKESLIYFRH